MKKNSLTNQAYGMIKRMIVTNELEPGEIVNEAELQSKLGIGRTPVHEALLRLSVEQFVSIIPRQGIEICKFSPRIVHSIFETRLMIEPAALRRAYALLDFDWLIAMRKNFAAINENHLLADADGLLKYSQYDTEFHAKFVTVMDNQYLSSLVDNYLNQLMAITIATTKVSDNSYNANKDHIGIIDCILAGNIEEACAVLEEHIRRCHVDVINTYLNNC